MYTCLCIAESLHGSPETATTLSINQLSPNTKEKVLKTKVKINDCLPRTLLFESLTPRADRPHASSYGLAFLRRPSSLHSASSHSVQLLGLQWRDGGVGEIPPVPAAQGRVGASCPKVTAREAAGPAEGAALIWGARADAWNSSCSLPCFPQGGPGCRNESSFLAWLEFSLVYFLLFEFSRIEVRVRASSGVMSISSVADSPHPVRRHLSTVVQVAGVGELSVLKSGQPQANQDDQFLQGVWRLGTSPDDLGSSQ